MRKLLFWGLILFLTFFETSAKSEIFPQAKLGRELFYDPSFGGTIDPNKASGMSCATCHADFDEEQEPDGQIRTGHSIIGVRDRGKSQWAKVTSDMFERAAGGAGFCYQRFLQRIPERKIDPSAIPEAQAEALMAYFDYMSVGKKSPEVKLQSISKDASKIAANQILKINGNAKNGWKFYARACANCHAKPKKGGIGPQMVKSRPPANLQKRLHKIASYVRAGGYTMPAIGEEKLSDQALADILAFISSLNKRQ